MKHLRLLLFVGVLFAVNSMAQAGQQRCKKGYWYSQEYNTCFKKKGHCDQYNYTDSRTCNTSKDNLRCDWHKKSRTCYAEDGHNQCPKGYWYSNKYNTCFKKKNRCKQYNGTDYGTCNTSKDHMRCDWHKQSRTCYRE